MTCEVSHQQSRDAHLHARPCWRRVATPAPDSLLQVLRLLCTSHTAAADGRICMRAQARDTSDPVLVCLLQSGVSFAFLPRITELANAG